MELKLFGRRAPSRKLEGVFLLNSYIIKNVFKFGYYRRDKKLENNSHMKIKLQFLVEVLNFIEDELSKWINPINIFSIRRLENKID